MLPVPYALLPFAVVENLADFFKSNLPETPKVKNIYENSKLSLNLPNKKVRLSVVEGERVYKYVFLTPGIHDVPMGWLVYLPVQKRLDFFLPESPMIPIIQWKGKKEVFKNYPMIYDLLGFDKLFDKIINSI